MGIRNYFIETVLVVEVFSHLKYSSHPSDRPFNTLSKEVGCHNLKNKQKDIQQRGSVALPRIVMPTRSNIRENSFHVIKLFAFGKFIYLCLYHSRTAYPVMHYRVSSISINILFNEFPAIGGGAKEEEEMHPKQQWWWWPSCKKRWTAQ